MGESVNTASQEAAKRVAIVTGSSRGIGKAIALRLAKEGINVVINYNSSEGPALEVVEKCKEYGVDAIAVKANTADQKEIGNLFREAFKYFGQIDYLVNNAGVVDDAYLMMVPKDSLDRSFEINVKGYFYACQSAALKMMKRGGRIVNISSVSGRMALAGQSVYSATKGAVNSLTQVLAKELGQYGITVNAVAPGFIQTEMIDAVPEEKMQEYLKAIPLGRQGTADEVAEVVNMLLGPAGDYITGQIITMDGGLSL